MMQWCWKVCGNKGNSEFIANRDPIVAKIVFATKNLEVFAYEKQVNWLRSLSNVFIYLPSGTSSSISS